MGINDQAWHVGFKWTIGDEDNPTGAICLDDSSDALHICEIADARTDWNVSSLSHPTLYVHSATTPETDYIALYHDGDYAYINVDGTNIMSLTAASVDIDVATTISGDLTIDTSDAVTLGGTLEVTGTSTLTGAVTCGSSLAVTGAVSSAINDGSALGSQYVCWSDLFLAAGAVITFSFGVGEVSLTHSSGALTLSSNDKLQFRDSGIHIYSAENGALSITADGYIALYGLTYFNSYIVLGKTDTTSSDTGSLWMHNTDQTLKYKTATVLRTIVNLEDDQTFLANLTMTTNKKLIFRSAANYIYSAEAGSLSFVATSYMSFISSCILYFNDATDASSSTVGAAVFAGGVAIAKKLFVGTASSLAGAVTCGSTLAVTSNLTVSAGDISVAQGQNIRLDGEAGGERIWSHAAGKIKITTTGTGFDDITLEGAVAAMDNIRIKTSFRLEFRDADIYIHSGEDGALNIHADQYVAIYDPFYLNGDTLLITNMPTSDPNVNNEIWNNSGVLTMSSG